MNLEKALKKILDDNEFTVPLAKVLNYAHRLSNISYKEVEDIVKENTVDVLLYAFEWKLFLPVKTFKSTSWEDRIFFADSKEKFEQPNIVKYLVKIAIKSGEWNSKLAIERLLNEMGEKDYVKIIKVIEKIYKESSFLRVSANQIKKICKSYGVGDRVDALIAHLKATGIISPKLSSFMDVSKVGCPLYDINPAVFI